MAGSNRTPASSNSHGAPVRGAPEVDAHGLAPVAHGEALSRWTPPQQAYAQQQQQQQQYQPQPGYGPAPGQQQAYTPPPAFGQTAPPQLGYPTLQPDPYTQPPTQPPHAGYATDAQPRQGYDRYAQQQQPAAPHTQPGHYDAHQHDAHQQRSDPHALSYPGDAQRGYAPQTYGQQGYAPQPGHAYGQPAPEQHNWDLANYAPGQAHQHQAQQQHAQQQQLGHQAQQQPFPGFDAVPQARADTFGAAHTLGHDPRYAPPQQANWPGQPAAHATAGHPGAGHSSAGHPGVGSGEPAFDLDRYAQPAQQGYAPQQAHPGHGQQAYAQQGYEQPIDAGQQAAEDFGYEDEPVEEKRRGPRAMVVVGALIGAIVVGGGLAMGYQMFSGGKGDSKVATPVVKAPATAVKSKPADAGGKDIADQDKKFANRLGAGGAATTTSEQAQVAGASATVDPDGPRKVQTLTIGRDGTMTAPPAAAAVPGMVVDGGFPTARPQLRGAAPQGEPATAPVVKQASTAPNIANLPLPPVKPEGVVKKATVERSSDAGATPPPTKKKIAARDDLVAPKGEVVASSGSGAGFVAALTSKKSRVEALGAFANLQQSYADLQGKVPDVKEVEIPEKGTWYRLVVGPPGSKEAAGDLCKKLKAQGHKDCWVTAY